MIKIELAGMPKGKKFSFCIMNPPYSEKVTGDGLYVKFLNKCIEISDNIISVNPSPAIVGHQSGSLARKEFEKVRQHIDNFYTEIELVDKTLFDAGIKSDLCIVSINKNKKHNIIFNKFGKIHNFDKQADIKHYFDNTYLLEFDNKIREFLKNSDYLESHIKLTKGYGDFAKAKLKENNPDKNLLYVYFIKPNASFPYAAYGVNNKNGFNTVKEYNETDQKVAACYVTFLPNEHKIAENFLKYLRTQFVQLCIKFANISDIGNVNRYMIIPWLDFSKSYTDEELFNMIGMEYNKEEINKILNVCQKERNFHFV